MHPLLLSRTKGIICYTGDTCPECAGLPVITPVHSSHCCFSCCPSGGKPHCLQSNYISLPKVRFSYVCSVIKVGNLWQISLDSCIGICFTIFSPVLQNISCFRINQNQPDKYLSVVTSDSFPPTNILLQLPLALLCPVCPGS